MSARQCSGGYFGKIDSRRAIDTTQRGHLLHGKADRQKPPPTKREQTEKTDKNPPLITGMRESRKSVNHTQTSLSTQRTKLCRFSGDFPSL